MSVLNSILDTDLYKLTMQQAVIKVYPEAQACYTFINRGGTAFPNGFAFHLRRAVNELSFLSLTAHEEEFLKDNCYYLSSPYIDFLKGYRYDPKEVEIVQEGDDLKLTISGPWYRTILWEVPLMALISELYFKTVRPAGLLPEPQLRDLNVAKAERLEKLGASFADFGTRRRFSFDNHLKVVHDLCKAATKMRGTSNLHFAMMYGLTPIGTQAHEWFMFHGAQFGFQMANDVALKEWVKVYQGDLGIALSDTFTTGAFFNAFTTKYAKLFDGIRHDSGNPIEFAEKVIQHYKRLSIDPTTKTIVFSDGLNVDKVEKIHTWCKDKIRCSYGIGTHFTNDVGATPLNIVIKMSQCRMPERSWLPTIKLSDDPGKHTGPKENVDLCKRTLEV